MSIIFAIFLILTVLLSSTTTHICPDFYWRDFNGTIPPDAVPAGTDPNGTFRYIGQAYIRGYELLPATILSQEGIARTSAYGRIFRTQKNVKVLCSNNKDAMEWTPIHSRDFHKHLSKNLVPGGNEVGESLYIGRIFRNNDVTIGKIFRHERNNRGIWAVVGNKVENTLDYEILWFDCAKNMDIDVRNKEILCLY